MIVDSHLHVWSGDLGRYPFARGRAGDAEPAPVELLNEAWAAPDQDRLWQRSCDLGASFCIHGPAAHLPAVEPIVARFPGVKVVLGPARRRLRRSGGVAAALKGRPCLRRGACLLSRRGQRCRAAARKGSPAAIPTTLAHEAAMKVGLYASMFGKRRDSFPDIESFIDLAYELRLDVIDLRSDVGFHEHGGPYLLATKMRCLRRGLSIGYLASGGHFVGDEAQLQEKLQRVRQDVDAALALGAPMVRVFCGEAPADAAARRREVACFQEACDFAAERGVAVGLQNHPSTGDGVLRLLEEVGRDNFAFILDTGQWVGSPARNRGMPDPAVDIYRSMEQTAKHAVHVRAKFYKIDSGREAWLDYDRILDILGDAGFNGAVSVVFEGQDINACDDREVLRLAAAQLRRLTG